jgi:hypothetical protein
MSADAGPLLTLEPLIDAIRDGVEGTGWRLSGLQKTTSHEYAGRWEGETSRSAYLFFHRPHDPDGVSIDVFLDETSRGIEGNLALVVDGAPIAQVGDPLAALAAVAAVASTQLTREGASTSPVSLRLRLDNPIQDVSRGQAELRIKVRITAAALRSGPAEVSALAIVAVRSFERLLEHREVLRYRDFD